MVSSRFRFVHAASIQSLRIHGCIRAGSTKIAACTQLWALKVDQCVWTDLGFVHELANRRTNPAIDSHDYDSDYYLIMGLIFMCAAPVGHTVCES
jgi:hypothetical protein